MRHVPCSWEKEYTFQPDIRASKDDWRACTKASYMYPPRSSTADAKRNSARFVQQSTLGLTAHRHPVGLPKKPTTSSILTKLGGTSRPGTRLSSAAAASSRPQQSSRGPPVAYEPPSSLANTYHVAKSDYRPSTTASSLPAGAQPPAILTRVGSSSGRGVSMHGSSNMAGRIGGHSRAGEAPNSSDDYNSFYSVVPESSSGGWQGTAGLPSPVREHASAHPESRERMYRETVRDRRNTHLRGGIVEPEWERQRMVMDLVGAQSADRLIEEGYDPRYRPPGALLDVRRKRRVLSGRDRAALTHQLFPENYKKPLPHREAESRRAASDTRKKRADYAVKEEEDGRIGSAYTTYDTPSFAPREDDRLSEGLTRHRLNTCVRNAHLEEGAAGIGLSAADRAGFYDVPKDLQVYTDQYHGRPSAVASSSDAFRAISQQYAAAGGARDELPDSSFYPHSSHSVRQGRGAMGGGLEVSVYHGRNGPLIVSSEMEPTRESALPLTSADAYKGIPDLVASDGLAAYPSASRVIGREGRAEPVLSPPRGKDRFDSFASIGAAEDASRRIYPDHSYSYASPHLLDRTPPPSSSFGPSRLLSSVAGRHREAIRVVGGKHGPVVVEDDDDDDDVLEGHPSDFRDDREVYVMREETATPTHPTDGGGEQREVFVRLSPQQVREAQLQLEGSSKGTHHLNTTGHTPIAPLQEPYFPPSMRS